MLTGVRRGRAPFQGAGQIPEGLGSNPIALRQRTAGMPDQFNIDRQLYGIRNAAGVRYAQYIAPRGIS